MRLLTSLGSSPLPPGTLDEAGNLRVPDVHTVEDWRVWYPWASEPRWPRLPGSEEYRVRRSGGETWTLERRTHADQWAEEATFAAPPIARPESATYYLTHVGDYPSCGWELTPDRPYFDKPSGTCDP